MSIQGDLQRNRAAFAALMGEGEAPVEQRLSPEERRAGLPLWREIPVNGEPVPAPLPPPRNAGAEREPPRRVVYTLGAVPGGHDRGEPAETALAYPDPMGERPAREDGGLVPDDTYKSLLRRFDQDARRESQPGSEEGTL